MEDDIFRDVQPELKKDSWKDRKSALQKKFFPTGFKYELKNILKIAIPVIFTNMLQFIIPMESITMCGHLSPVEMEGVALANSMINAFGIAIGTGLCTACDTLFAQAYGSKDKKLTGMFLQRSIFIISLAPLVLWALHINMEPIFVLLKQDPKVAQIAAHYMVLFSPGILFHFNYLILARYMQNQDRVYPPMVIGVIGNVFNIASQYIFIYVLGYRYEASAICQVLTFFLMWFGEIIYILWTKFYEETWDGWTTESLFEWKPFLILAIAGVGHSTLEEIGWEILVFIAGTWGGTELATQSILFQTEVLTYMVPLGLGVALNIRVGQYLGGNNPQGARTSLNVVFTATFLSIIIISGKDVIPKIFSIDPATIEMTSSIMPYMVFVIYTDNVSGICGGVLRGCGRQTIGAVIIFVGYYFCGFPLALILGFAAKLYLPGLWIGMTIGLAVCTACLVFVLFRQNWDEQAQKVRHTGTKAQETLSRRPLEELDTATTETTAILLSPAKSDFLSAIPSHIRTPSHPFGCSTEVLPPPKRHYGGFSSLEVKRVFRNRIIIAILLFVFFSAFVILHVTLPRSFYWPVDPEGNLTATTESSSSLVTDTNSWDQI